MDNNTNHPVALVTGASSGIGLHYAQELAFRGYNVILVSNQEHQLKKAAAQIASQTSCQELSDRIPTLINDPAKIREMDQNTATGRWVIGLYKDLAMEDAAQELFDFRADIDVLINNAGIFFFNDIADCSMLRIETMINLHVLTLTKLCRLYGERMRSKQHGYILNMSSISVHTPFAGIALYTATKSFINTFTKALHDEMKEHGVVVMVVLPGAVATDLYSLPKNLQKLGVRLGIIYRPERLTRKALDKLFKGKKEFIPGCINHLFSPIFAMIPGCVKMWVRRKTKYIMK